jgi:hypothetical protein
MLVLMAMISRRRAPRHGAGHRTFFSAKEGGMMRFYRFNWRLKIYYAWPYGVKIRLKMLIYQP